MTDNLTESVAIIDLRVDRNLLNPHFDSYRLSIDPMTTYCQPLDSCVNEFRPNDDDFSYLQLSMASHFNHLFSDPFSSEIIFFATKFGQLMSLSMDLRSEGLPKPKTVYTIPDSDSALISISFPNNDLSLISKSDHKSPEVYVLSTPNRSASEPWIQLSVIRLNEFEINNRFHVFCSQSMDLNHNSLQIDFILGFVDKTPNNNDLDKSSFISVLNWFTITGSAYETNSWSVKRHRRMVGNDWPKYITFDVNESPLLCVVSEKDFKFVYDSDKPIVETNSQTKTTTEEKLLCTYCQTLEDICVTFKLPVHICKNDISIDLKPNNICVKIKDLIEFEGQLCHTIDANSSVWTLISEKGFQLLEITFNKADNGLVWSQLIVGNHNCVEIESKAMNEEIYEKLKHLTNELPDIDSNQGSGDVFNPSGLEECDFADNSLTFNRYNGNTHSISHRIDLSGSQWLFSIPVQKSDFINTNDLPYFVVRHDVDALVWAPKSSSDSQFDVKHVSTFSAFGYVQASKTNARFMVAANDFNYVAIADGIRHVYIYRQPIGIKSGEIRNRRTGQELQTIATQHVINLTDCLSIIGIKAVNNYIFVLSYDKIFLIKL